MTRYVVVDWENRKVERETFVSAQDAWRFQCELARKQGRSPNEWDACEVEVEAR